MDSQKTEGNSESVVVPSNEVKKSDRKKSFWHINRETLKFKLHFFLFIGAMGLIMPFITIFATTRIGLSGTSLGVLLTAQQFLFIFTKPLMGYLADYFNKLKEMIGAKMLIFALSMFLLLPIPGIGKESSSTTYGLSELCGFYKANSPPLVENLFEQCLDDNISWTTPTDLSSLSNVPCCGHVVEMLSGSMLKFGLEVSNSSCISETEMRNYTVKNGSEPGDLFALSHANSSNQWNFCCQSSNSSYRISCGYDRINTEIEESDFLTYQFWIYAIVSTVGLCCCNTLFTLSDTACCESMQKTGSDFGKQRLFGAIGWGLFSVVGGLMFDYTGSYLPSFVSMGVMSLLAVWNISKLDLVKPQYSQNILKDVGTVLKSKEFLVFEVGVLICGMATSIMWFYQVIFLTSIGASRLLCGLVQGVQCFVGEAPFMFHSGWFIEKIGHFNVISLTMLSYTIRFLWYSFLTNPWLILPVEVLHGITYGLFYPTLASYAKKSAKPGTEATTQAVIFTTFEGLGAGLGCIVFGYMSDHVGWQKIFLGLTFLEASGMIFMIASTVTLRWCSS